ncbi:MAG: phenylalanine--tRNA ligase subunit alpha [Nanoarchaeota archaeon]|nr:phenylalanine--tRNA ligase subunit alpha [Nanoarchaeota archaeon]
MAKIEDSNLQDIIEKLSPLEIKIVPFLNHSIEKIREKSELDEVSIQRALKFLEAKGILKLTSLKINLIDLGTNGIYYKKNHLPERSLLLVLETNNHIHLEEAKKLSKLSENEFKVSLGVLKNKAMISLTNGKISLSASKAELTKKFLEEQLIDILPTEKETLPPELLHALENLKKRKEIIEIKEKNIISFELTELGKKIAGKEIKSDLIEEVTSEVIKNWSKNKKFRKYDLNAQVPKIYGGKKHFVNYSIEQGKKIWLELGFKEMSGDMITTSFWNFDALFTPQDHPVREMQDTFFIKDVKGQLPEKEIISSIKKAHENGVSGSKGWQYSWNPENAKSVLLRTHTTCLSAKTLVKLRNEKLPAKYFAIGKCFRNETVDWSHGFEFNQSEGIVIDENANFRHLLGYLQEFYKKMGFEKIRFRPSFFPYTEPSVEIDAFHPEKKIWLEIGGAGMFRPEVVYPLLGKNVPVLAWGPGFDRIMMLMNEISDLREVYKNDIKVLRDKKVLVK